MSGSSNGVPYRTRYAGLVAALTLAAVAALVLSTLVPQPAQAKTYYDVPSNSWYHNYIDDVSNLGIMTGYTIGDVETGEFGPEYEVTRGQVATVLYRMSHDDDSATTVGSQYAQSCPYFYDVRGGEYYTAAVNWCYECGYVTGDTGPGGVSVGTFRPDDNITREELATILWRYQGSPSGSVDIYDWPDGYLVSSFATTAVSWAATNGIMTGGIDSTGTWFLPQDNARRGQMAKMISVMLGLSSSTEPEPTPEPDPEPEPEPEPEEPADPQPTDISGASVFVEDQYYTGGALTPQVTVMLGEVALVEGVDYVVTYANNAAVGTATVTVTGIGDYAGTVSGSFNIIEPEPTYEQLEQQIVDAIITDGMTDLDKITAITEYVAENFDYGSGSSASSMLENGSGSCWASTDLIIDLCSLVGIEASWRTANFMIDGSASGHANAIAKVDGTYYVLDAGFSAAKPRPYTVNQEDCGFTMWGKGNSGTGMVLQYDGWGVSDLAIPEYLTNGYTGEAYLVTYLGYAGTSGYPVLDQRSCFYRSDSDVRTVTIPASVEYISEYFFAGETTLTAIYVDPANPYYKSVDGVLYDMSDNLVHWPSQK